MLLWQIRMRLLGAQQHPSRRHREGSGDGGETGSGTCALEDRVGQPRSQSILGGHPNFFPGAWILCCNFVLLLFAPGKAPLIKTLSAPLSSCFLCLSLCIRRANPYATNDMEILLPSQPGNLAADRRKPPEPATGLTFALQALLTRHESYVNESQLERERFESYIDALEQERAELQTANEKVAEENRQLLAQLETANNSTRDSDSHVKSLEALLRDCEVEVRRLNGLNRRTEELELKIMDLEKERMVLSQKAEDSVEETRSTIRRWKASEIKLKQLESAIQRIESDAKQDKERFEEIIARMERERAIERELSSAEGRLKSAAALQTINGKRTGIHVVGHFVRDILQDNANLQAGIVELRELLQASNEEVQILREQILQHQPIGYDLLQEDGSTTVSLSEQLGWSSPKQVHQSVHVHHHYHAKAAGKRERPPVTRKPSRKRTVLSLGMLPSTPESSQPNTPVAGPSRLGTSPLLPLTLHQPQARRNRWSVQSAATGSSIISSFPSSPRSYYDHSSSIFDRLEAGEDSSRPTSPESVVDLADSPCRPFNQKPEKQKAWPDRPEAEDIEHLQAQVCEAPESSEFEDGNIEQEAEDSWSHDLTPKPSQILIPDESIYNQKVPEPPDAQPDGNVLPVGTDSVTPSLNSHETHPTASPPGPLEHVPVQATPTSPPIYSSRFATDFAMEPALRRTSSRDSLVSISGMDIHLVKRTPLSTSRSISLLRGNQSYLATAPAATRRLPAAQPSTTVTEFTALSSIQSPTSEAMASVPFLAQSPGPSGSMSINALNNLANLPTSSPGQSTAGGLGRLVGGWVRGKWGMAPMKSSADLRSPASPATSPADEIPLRSPPPLPFGGGRPPGINQKGPIPGFRPPPRAMTVQVKMVDEQGLRESLAE